MGVSAKEVSWELKKNKSTKGEDPGGPYQE